jgi:hypothetical protein
MSASSIGSADTGSDRNPGTVPGPAARGVPAVIDPRRDIMHPMFKELFIHTDADDLPAEEDRRRRVRRSQPARPALVVRPAAGNRQQRPRP